MTPDADPWGRPRAGDDVVEEAAAVRPYALTRGRVRPSGPLLPFEALVGAVQPPAVHLPPEQRRILELTEGQYLSVAELSAHLHLPIGVVRILVGDLVDAGLVRVHGPGRAGDRATTLGLLESVLNGISTL